MLHYKRTILFILCSLAMLTGFEKKKNIDTDIEIIDI